MALDRWEPVLRVTHLALPECDCGSTDFEQRMHLGQVEDCPHPVWSRIAYRCRACGDVDIEPLLYDGQGGVR